MCTMQCQGPQESKSKQKCYYYLNCYRTWTLHFVPKQDDRLCTKPKARRHRMKFFCEMDFHFLKHLEHYTELSVSRLCWEELITNALALRPNIHRCADQKVEVCEKATTPLRIMLCSELHRTTWYNKLEEECKLLGKSWEELKHIIRQQ